MEHGGSQDDFGFGLEQAVVALSGILETLGIGMFLAGDEGVLEYLAVEHFHLLVLQHGYVPGFVGNGVELAVFQGLDDESAGFLFQETFDTEDDATFEREVFGYILPIFVVELTHHAMIYVIHGPANLALGQHDVAFLELHRYQNLRKDIDAQRTHFTIETGDFSGYVSRGVHHGAVCMYITIK